MPAWLLVALIFLATFRATRLAVQDDIPLVKVPRDAVARYFGVFDAEGNLVAGRQLGRLGWSIAYVTGCPWCTSAYTGALIVWATTWFASVPVPLLVWAAASAVTGLIANAEAMHDQRFEVNELDIARGKAAAAMRR